MKDRRIEITGILLIAVSVFILISLIGYSPYEEPQISPNINIQNPMGILGVYISHYLIKILFGYISILIPIMGIVWGWWLIGKKKIKELWKITLYILLGIFLFSVSLGIIGFIRSTGNGHSYLTAGFIGNIVAELFIDFLGKIGASVLIVAGWLVLFRSYFSWNYYDVYKKLIGNRIAEWQNNRKIKKEKKKHTEKLISKIDERTKSVEKIQQKDFLQESVDIEKSKEKKTKKKSLFSNLKSKDRTC